MLLVLVLKFDSSSVWTVEEQSCRRCLTRRGCFAWTGGAYTNSREKRAGGGGGERRGWREAGERVRSMTKLPNISLMLTFHGFV